MPNSRVSVSDLQIENNEQKEQIKDYKIKKKHNGMLKYIEKRAICKRNK